MPDYASCPYVKGDAYKDGIGDDEIISGVSVANTGDEPPEGDLENLLAELEL